MAVVVDDRAGEGPVARDVEPKPATILVVEDEPALRETLVEALGLIGYSVISAASGRAALDLMEITPPDAVLTDVRMDGLSGVELCRAIKADPRFQLTPVVILTAGADLDSRIAGLAAGADDFFPKPVNLLELRTRLGVLLRVKGLVDDLERAEQIIESLSMTIEARDPYTAGHCVRIARYAVGLGRALGLDGATLKALRLAGFLHDLGKIAIPDGILLKPGPLDAAEREVIRRHPLVGAELVGGMRTLDAVRPLMRHHHERMDGSGYPDGLRGDAIPVGARILAVADVFDALRTARPYKQPLSQDAALAIMRRETDAGAWDPRVVTALVEGLTDGSLA